MRTLLIAALASISLPTLADDRPVIDRVLIEGMDRWRVCVRNVFISQANSGTERNMAVEMAFIACDAEQRLVESAMLSHPNPYTRRRTPQLFPMARARIKMDLLGQR